MAMTKRKQKAALGPYGKLGQTINELDERLGIAKGGRTFMDKIFPDHWSFMLGEIALYSFVVLLATGIFLTLYFVPSGEMVTYKGAFAPLFGTKVSAAYASSVDLSLFVRGGLLMRQMHHWACDIFVGSIVVHMMRVFFTGAFRKPRETNWLVGVNLMILAITNGFLGYSLPDDLVSGTGLRIAYSIMESVPVVGTYLAFFVFGGNFPGTAWVPRFFVLHVLLIPLIILGLLGGHLALLVRQKHTQFPGPGRTERNVVGSPMFPVFIFKTTGFLFIVAGVTALLGAFTQINPIWQFGQYEAARISYAVQPDWYMGFWDGFLRIMPSWEFVAFGHTIPLEVTIPAVVFPGILFNIIMVWPMLERKFTKDNDMHHLLERPRDNATRTAIGASVFALVFMMFIASSTDVIANYLHTTLNSVLVAMRVLVVIAPFVTYPIAKRICIEMQNWEKAGARKTVNLVTRTADGEYLSAAAPEADDTHHESEAIAVPTFLVEAASTSASTGVRTVER
jgi:ubiquinol-cytochrome c reductase cytochrome b subunit